MFLYLHFIFPYTKTTFGIRKNTCYADGDVSVLLRRDETAKLAGCTERKKENKAGKAGFKQI